MDLLVALHEVTKRFGAFGYDQFLKHPSVHWELLAFRYGSTKPMARVGCSFLMRNDPEGVQREVTLVVDVTVGASGFVISGAAEIDEPLEVGGEANVRDLITLPTVQTTDLDECLAALRDHARRLCSATTLLDDLGVPRGGR
ncbi:hypothetical protein [Actinomadura sp. 6N118]|uniref:hypothetical protein n=1 Tax=Actinomadura sp. 6N118 TaxID=3375151 RepID=UPI0037B56045